MSAARCIIGLDIGGANLKASDGEHRSSSMPFALWREPERLSTAIAGMLREFPQPSALAVTMTGELADCFATKAEGVDRILSAVEEAAPLVPVAVWHTGGEFLTPVDARELVALVAAANWHALATWAGRAVATGAGLLIDIGSTTSDIIPFRDGIPATEGQTDLGRLQANELVYTGVRRTPICAIAEGVPLRDVQTPLAAELFATMLDVYLVLGDIEEDASDVNTANGKPATVDGARDRLARMLCCDVSEISPSELTVIARTLADAQHARLQSAVEAVVDRGPQSFGQMILAGEGEFLARRVVGRMPRLAGVPQISLSQVLGKRHSEAACAYALACLGRERAIVKW